MGDQITPEDPAKDHGDLSDPETSDYPVIVDDPVTLDESVTSDGPPAINFDPPDGGYGWVVVLCGWFSLLAMSGTFSMFGMMYPYILQTFGAGNVYTVAVFTSTNFCLYIICVFAGSLCDMFGCRVVALLGNAIATVGIMAAFASNFTVLFLSYGVMTGCGFGCVYMANVVIIQQYFTKKRSIAFGIANSGIGMGMFVYAPLTRHLLQKYDWRGTLLMLAAVWLHGMITASLLKPLPAPPPPSPLAAAKWKAGSSPSFYSSLPMMAGISSSQLSQLGQSYRSLSFRQHVDKYTTSQQQLGTSSKNLRTKGENFEESHSINGAGLKTVASRSRMNSVQQEHIGASQISTNSKLNHITQSQLSVSSSEQKMTPCSVCTHLATSVWSMMDLKALANIYVLLFTLITLMCGAFNMIPVYLPRKCMEAGLSSAQVTILLSNSGLMDTAGRILFGILGYRFDFTILHGICITATGVHVCMMSIAFIDNFWVLLFSLSYGYLCFGGYANMLSATIVDFVGVEKFARVFGFVLCGASLGFILAGPAVAQIYTVSQSYKVVFVVCGCMQLTGALLCAIVLILRALNCGTIYHEEPETKEV